MFNDIPQASGIYRITCTTTGLFYIGSSVNLRERQQSHYRVLRLGIHHNPRMQRAFAKYGEQSFIFEVLEFVLIPSLTMREQYWMNKLKPFGKRGFNLVPTAGSQLGMKHSAETLEQMRISHTGKTHRPETIQKMRLARPGYAHRPESIAKMQASHAGKKGTPHTPEDIAKMVNANAHRMKTLIVTSPDGTEYLVTGINQFCREHQINHSNLIGVANGKARHCKGWKARYPEQGIS